MRYRSRGFPLHSRDFKTHACDPRRGVIVATLTRQGVLDAYAVRAHLEGLACRIRLNRAVIGMHAIDDRVQFQRLRGGSNYFAKQLNAARDVLLKRDRRGRA